MGGGAGCAPGVLLNVPATARTSSGDKPASDRYSGNPSAYGTSAINVAKFCSFIFSGNKTGREDKPTSGDLIYAGRSRLHMGVLISDRDCTRYNMNMEYSRREADHWLCSCGGILIFHSMCPSLAVLLESAVLSQTAADRHYPRVGVNVEAKLLC